MELTSVVSHHLYNDKYTLLVQVLGHIEAPSASLYTDILEVMLQLISIHLWIPHL